MPEGATELTTPLRLTAGALAGITSVIMTYPLDITRTRLSVQSSSLSAIRSTHTDASIPGKHPKPPGTAREILDTEFVTPSNPPDF